MAIGTRKDEHLEICRRGAVEHGGSTLLEEVTLIHEALPELALEQVDLSGQLFGRAVAAPIVIAGMTGGTAEAGRVNRALAELAQKRGLAMGLGSQRAMLVDPTQVESYAVRAVAPDIPLLANIGFVQATRMHPAELWRLVDAVGADALCVHLNAAQELVQHDGDRDFRGALARLEELAWTLPFEVVVKETGCGMAPGTLDRLVCAGLRWVDVSGAGGTSWTRVEAQRGPRSQRALGEVLADWGTPTAACLVYARRRGLATIASGGVRDALDAARALALGADAVAMALPFLRGLEEGGAWGLDVRTSELVEALRAVLLLTGSRDIAALRESPRLLGPTLRDWIDADPSEEEARQRGAQRRP